VVGLGIRGRSWLVAALIALYVPLAGAGPSIQRAGAMGAATTVAALAGRPASRWYALLLAAAATLAHNPRASGDPGWQLSFAAVTAIALLAPGVRAALRKRGAPEAVADATAMSLAATLGTAPLLALHFGELSLVGLPANLLAAPAIAPITWLGMLAAALGQLTPALAIPLNTLNQYLLAYVACIAHVAASIPHASVRL
jgi:competence protein ComEC